MKCAVFKHLTLLIVLLILVAGCASAAAQRQSLVLASPVARSSWRSPHLTSAELTLSLLLLIPDIEGKIESRENMQLLHLCDDRLRAEAETVVRFLIETAQLAQEKQDADAKNFYIGIKHILHGLTSEGADKDFHDAIPHLKSLLVRAERDALLSGAVKMLLARCLYARVKGSSTLTIAYLRQVAENTAIPEAVRAGALLLLANVAESVKAFEIAFPTYESILQQFAKYRNRRSTIEASGRLEIAFKMLDDPQAEELFENQFAPATHKAYIGLGRVALARKRPEQALPLFQKALAAAPEAETAAVYYSIALTYKELDENEKALDIVTSQLKRTDITLTLRNLFISLEESIQ